MFSNYYLGTIFYRGHAYPSVEHAYQAQKTPVTAMQQAIRDCASPGAAKRLAHTLVLRHGWEEMKVSIMAELLLEKFSAEPARSVLLGTGDAELVEGNYWGDCFWGQCPVGQGENWLGRLLMTVRDRLRGGEFIAASETWQPVGKG